MIPYNIPFTIDRIGVEILKAYSLATPPRIPGDDAGYCDWPSRVWYDALANNYSLETSLFKHLYGPGELYDSLGITKPFPNPPTREQVIHIKGNFLNLRDSQDVPVWDAFIDYLIINDINRANEWIQLLHQAGTTHINLDISGDYAENLGWAPRYPIPGTDWTNDLISFSKILDYIITNGFIPHIHLASDGQGIDPVGMTKGWQWGIDNVPSIIQALDKYKKYCLWNGGWDGCFPDWTPAQTVQYLRMLRAALGNDGQIAAEFNGPNSETVGYTHLGNGSADWNNNQLDILDVFLVELLTYPNNEIGVAQVATRLLGPGAKNTSMAPYYLNGQKEVGICYFEPCAYQAIRKQVSNNDCVAQARIGQKYGFNDFGMGIP